MVVVVKIIWLSLWLSGRAGSQQGRSRVGSHFDLVRPYAGLFFFFFQSLGQPSPWDLLGLKRLELKRCWGDFFSCLMPLSVEPPARPPLLVGEWVFSAAMAPLGPLRLENSAHCKSTRRRCLSVCRLGSQSYANKKVNGSRALGASAQDPGGPTGLQFKETA